MRWPTHVYQQRRSVKSRKQLAVQSVELSRCCTEHVGYTHGTQSPPKLYSTETYCLGGLTGTRERSVYGGLNGTEFLSPISSFRAQHTDRRPVSESIHWPLLKSWKFQQLQMDETVMQTHSQMVFGRWHQVLLLRMIQNDTKWEVFKQAAGVEATTGSVRTVGSRISQASLPRATVHAKKRAQAERGRI